MAREEIDKKTVERLQRLGREPLRGREEILVDTVISPGVVYEIDDEISNRWAFAETGVQRARRYLEAIKIVSPQCDGVPMRQLVLRPKGDRPEPGGLDESLKRLSQAYDKRFGYLVRSPKRTSKAGRTTSQTSAKVAPLLSALHLIVDSSGKFDPHLHVMCCISDADLPDVLEYLRKHFLLTPESGVALVTPARFAYYMSSHVLPYANLKDWPDSHLLAFWDLTRRRFLRPAGLLSAHFAAQNKKPRRKSKSKKSRTATPEGNSEFTLRGYVQGNVDGAATVFAQLYRRRQKQLGPIEPTRVEVHAVGRVLGVNEDTSSPNANTSGQTEKTLPPNSAGSELGNGTPSPDMGVPALTLESLPPEIPRTKKRKSKAVSPAEAAGCAYQSSLRIFVPNLDDLFLTRLFLHHRMDMPSRTFDGTCVRMQERPDRIRSAIQAVESFMECSLFQDGWTPSQHGRYFLKKFASPFMELMMLYVDLSAERRLTGTKDADLLPAYRHLMELGAPADIDPSGPDDAPKA